MTLVSSLIADAYRESNMLALGKDPTPAQVTEALRLYNQLLSMTYGGDAGEPLNDWPLGTYDRNPQDDNYLLPYSDHQIVNPPLNMRLIALQPAAMTVYLPTRPQDGSRMAVADPYGRLADVPLTLDGNDRPIEGGPTLTLATDGTFREWIYRADLSAWVRITNLLVDDDHPFPADFDIMWTILLAMRLNPRYGRQLDPLSQAMFKKNERQFIARYLQSRPLEINDSISWPFLSRQGYDTQRAFSSQRAFDRGDFLER